jgi:hypothetical protein
LIGDDVFYIYSIFPQWEVSAFILLVIHFLSSHITPAQDLIIVFCSDPGYLFPIIRASSREL